jgi:hypothetical protein
MRRKPPGETEEMTCSVYDELFPNCVLCNDSSVTAVALHQDLDFDIHVTVHPDKFLKIKPTRCTNFSNLFFE